MLLTTDTLIIILLLMGAVGPYVALGGHGAIAWTAIKRYYRRIGQRIQSIEDRAARLEDTVKSINDRILGAPPAPDLPAILKAELPAILEEAIPDASEALEAYFSSEEGQAKVHAYVSDMGRVITEGLRQWMEGVVGGAAKSSDAKAASILSANVDFGNPMANTIWSLMPPQQKRYFMTQAAKLLRQQGMAELAGQDVEQPYQPDATPQWR